MTKSSIKPQSNYSITTTTKSTSNFFVNIKRNFNGLNYLFLIACYQLLKSCGGDSSSGLFSSKLKSSNQSLPQNGTTLADSSSQSASSSSDSTNLSDESVNLNDSTNLSDESVNLNDSKSNSSVLDAEGSLGSKDLELLSREFGKDFKDDIAKFINFLKEEGPTFKPDTFKSLVIAELDVDKGYSEKFTELLEDKAKLKMFLDNHERLIAENKLYEDLAGDDRTKVQYIVNEFELNKLIKSQNDKGETFLHLSIRRGIDEQTKTLVDRFLGTDVMNVKVGNIEYKYFYVNKQDDKSKTAFDLSVEMLDKTLKSNGDTVYVESVIKKLVKNGVSKDNIDAARLSSGYSDETKAELNKYIKDARSEEGYKPCPIKLEYEGGEWIPTEDLPPVGVDVEVSGVDAGLV